MQNTWIILSLLISTSVLAAPYNPKESLVGIDQKMLDTKTDPCDDFYQYACGNWIKNLDLPSDKNQVTRSFTEIYDRNLDVLHAILETDSKNAAKETDADKKKLGDFYASCMNESAIEKDSPKAFEAELAALDGIFKTKEDLAAALAHLHMRGVHPFFFFGEETDLVDPSIKIANFFQSGYGLPDSTYYTSSEPSKVKLRAQYKEHLAKMFELLGKKKSEVKALADSTYAIEETLAKDALTPVEASDPTQHYHPSVIEDLKKISPAFNWDVYLKGISIETPKKIDLSEPKFLAAVQTLIQGQDLETLRNYLHVHMIDAYAEYLGKKTYDTWFQFYGITLSGQKKSEPRWKRCIGRIGGRHGGMGEALGKNFVEKTFSPKAKDRAQEMITNIRKALKEDLAGLDWLDDATRKKAQEKLEFITQKIGYPDRWKDYSDLKIVRGSYLENVIHSSEFGMKDMLKKIGGPVDPTLWGMTPQTVNAYYAPDLNQINFPAGILQAPFFNEKFSDAANYGGIGVVIGHEITHGFDTVGSKFDGKGKMSDWWTAKVKTQFEEKAACMKKQYSGYQPIPGVSINGDLTITENIADNGGVKISYAAYKMSKLDRVKNNPEMDKEFFLSMAQSWCRKATDEAIHRQVSSDPHSPAKFRINGPFQNNADFAKVYACKEGSKMAPKDRCYIW